MTQITFNTSKDGFYNETIKTLVGQKVKVLDKFTKGEDVVLKHKIRKNGDHKVEVTTRSKHTSAEHHNFETALIEAVGDMERVLRKEKEQRIQSKRQPKHVEVEVEELEEELD